MKGVVKWFNHQKGFGFVLGDDDADYFVHVSQVPIELRLDEKMSVEFDVVKTEKGAQANNVRLL